MIRTAKPEDIPELVEMGRRFAETATPHVGFDAASVKNLLAGLIENENGLVLRSTDGMFGAVVYPHPFNNAHRVAQEMFWWSEGREGLLLLKEAEKRLESVCDSMVMITLETVKPDTMSRLYQRNGFVPMERGFVKEMSWG